MEDTLRINGQCTGEGSVGPQPVDGGLFLFLSVLSFIQIFFFFENFFKVTKVKSTLQTFP